MEETRLAYARQADAYAERTQSFPEGSTLPHELRAFASLSHGLLLDGGAGAGRDALFLDSLGRRVIALDSSHRLLTHVPEATEVTCIQGDLRAIPLRAGSISGIWCSGVLLHMDRALLQECLVECARVLEPEGVIQVSVKEGSGHVAELMPGGGHLLRHFFRYSVDEMSQFAARAGLRVRSVWSVRDADSSEVMQTWVKLLLSKRAT